MAWVWLVAAIVCEVGGTLSLKQSAGFSVLLPSIGVVVGYGAAFVLLGQALRTFEVGTAYALWSGLGTALVVLAGVVLFGEGLGPVKIAGIVLIVGGIALLNLAGAH